MRLSPFLVVGLASSALSAQQPAHPASDISGSAISSGHGLWRESGILCGGGPHYRVEFRADGASYIPALAAAPQTFPLRLALENIHRSAEEVQATDAQPTRRRSSALYDRGHGVTECYELGADGIEQSFVLARSLPGLGDVVVRLRVHTELTPDRTGDVSDGMRWMTERWGGVEIGRAAARDARGRDFAMTMQCDGHHLELILPAASADAAHYPLVLDPPIGTLKGISGTHGDTNPDAAYDTSTDRYLVVWNRRLSATKSEIFGHLLNGNAGFVGSLIPIETGSVVAINPTIASVNNRFMVAWQQAPSLFGPWNVHGRAIDASAAQSSSIQITSNPANEIEPDLGSGSSAGASTIPLIWNRVGVGVRGAPVTVPSAGNPQRGPGETSIRSGVIHRPRISKNGGAGGNYVVAWETEPSSGNPEIEVAVVNNSAIQRTGPTVVSSGSSSYGRPAVDGNGTHFMVVYEKTLSVNDHDVYCRALRYDGTPTLRLTTSERRIGATAGDQITPDVGWLGPKYAVAWADDGNRSRFLDYDLHVVSLSPKCEVCDNEHIVRQLPSVYDHDPAIASQRSGGGSGTEALVMFSVVENAGLRTSVRGRLFGAFGNGGTANVVGAGCGNGGTLSFAGPLAYGNVGLRVELRGADPGAALAALFLGFTSRTFPCGSCTIINPVVTLPAAISGGAASLPLPVSCSLFGITTVGDLQWVTLAAAGSPCPIVPSLATSDRVRMTIGL